MSRAAGAAEERHRRKGLPTILTVSNCSRLVPLSMSTIDALEKGGVFPSRFRLEPTTRVAWKRREVEKWLAQRACKRVHQATTGLP
jgi:predicted DNA-binding transcriptional regulator AlpA